MNPPAADRNLLFGILAVQMDFVAQESLIRAMNAWVLDKTKPLGLLLVEQGDLSADRRGLLEALVEEHLQQHGQDVSQSLAAVSSVSSAREALGQIDDQEVQASLAGLSAGQKPGSTSPHRGQAAETIAAALPTMSVNINSLPGFRYQILRPHAKGGLGEVLVARDQELHREVALKQIQDNRADDPDNRIRFLMEAEITGGLEHPGIVPVYGLGHYENGRPYYAMRFIRGDSLKEAIARYHGKLSNELDDSQATTPDVPGVAGPSAKETRASTERNLELRGLLGRFIDVCNAMAYAHSRGVLHRDLKPGNIMLGKYGETLVVDWGLAKPHSIESASGSEEPQLEPSCLSDSAQTLMGSAVGTPQFMSPEQAAGRLNELGPASDVYSLGATLYCLLTGRAPFQGRDVGAMLKQVQNGEFPSPRRIDRSISRSLTAICLKAMALKPQDRYATPRDLAEDVEKWLADEPVTAYRETLGERGSRWARQHKPWVIAGALLLVTAVVGLTGSNILIHAERERTQEALADVERSRKAAEQALAKAQAAETARIQSQVDALLSAQPDSVPAILEALEPVREAALPRLRRHLERENLPASQTMRIHLALLPEQPELIEDFRQELHRADSQEFAMLREGLLDHQAKLREPLWQTLQDKDADQSARFRAACALAAFDPDNPRWPDFADEVSEWLVHQNPLVLETWVEMLEPMHAVLLPALTRQFHESTAPEIRSVANNVVGRWAADQLDLLARLLKDADPAQFAALIPQLRAHKDQAVSHFKATLEKTLAAVWPALPTDWPNPEPRFAEQIDQAQGLITDEFALVQTLPLEKFPQLAEGLKPARYRPVRYRPYPHRGQILVAAVWHRDDKPWKWETSLTKDALLEQNEAHQKAGFAPVDVAGYLLPKEPQTDNGADSAGDDDSPDRFGAIWVQSDLKPEESRLLCGLEYFRYSKTVAQYQRQSNAFGLMTLQVFHSKDQIVRYSSVLQVRPENQAWQSLWGATEQQFETTESTTLLQNDVSLTHLESRPRPQSPFHKELIELASGNDQGSGLGQSFIRPVKDALNALGDGQDKRAVESLTQAINTVKILPQPYYLRSLAHARLGNSTEAKQDYLAGGKAQRRAIPLLTAEQGRSFANFEAYTFSLVSAHLGEPNVGEQQLDTFLAAHDKQPDALYLAARAYAQMSQVVKHAKPRDDLEPKLDDADTLSQRYAARAVAMLEQAYQNGLDDATGVLFTQPDFDPIRDLPGFRKLIEDQHPLRRFALVLHSGNIRFESRRTEGTAPQQHLTECRQLLAEGFRPVAISASTPIPIEGADPRPTVSEEPVAISVWQRPLIFESDRIQHARQQANSALAVWQLDPQQDHWPLIDAVDTPGFEAAFIRRAALMKLAPQLLIARLTHDITPRAKRMTLLALGHYEYSELSAAERQSIMPIAASMYRDDPDAGIHSAAEWLLRKWYRETSFESLRKSMMSNRPREKKRWYINGQGQTLAVVRGPVEFMMGASATDRNRMDDELRHRVRIDRAFAVATTETTVTQYLRYDPDADFIKTSSPDPDGPMINVDWFAAVKYCRWLSEQEGVPEDQMCYPPIEEIGPSMTIPADFLSRTGYRLPTEAEWEYAARAGVDAKFAFGDDPALLGDYCWSKSNANNAAHRVGLLIPNRLGLFDVMGNAGEWCHDEYRVYQLPPRGLARIDALPIEVNGFRVGRGGSLLSDPSNCRLPRRFSWTSNQHFRDVGFRVVRTLPPVDPE